MYGPDELPVLPGYVVVGMIHDEYVLEKARPMTRDEVKARLLADRMPEDPVAAEILRWERIELAGIEGV